MQCPDCGDSLSGRGVCGSCGYGIPKPASRPALGSPSHRLYTPSPLAPISRSDLVAAEVNALLAPGRKRDPKDWARKILANPRGYPMISVAFANEALGVLDREPGSDDE